MNRRDLLGGGAAGVATLMLPVPKALPAVPAPVEVAQGEVVFSDEAYLATLAMVFAFYVNAEKLWRVAASSEHPVPSHPQHQDDQDDH